MKAKDPKSSASVVQLKARILDALLANREEDDR